MKPKETKNEYNKRNKHKNKSKIKLYHRQHIPIFYLNYLYKTTHLNPKNCNLLKLGKHLRVSCYCHPFLRCRFSLATLFTYCKSFCNRLNHIQISNYFSNSPKYFGKKPHIKGINKLTTTAGVSQHLTAWPSQSINTSNVTPRK